MEIPQEDLTKAQKVGLLWDHYTPSVEAQICRDIIALINQPAYTADNVVVCCDSDRADRLLATLGVRRVPMESLATVWIVYKVGADTIIAPEHAETVIVRDLYVPEADANINPEGGSGYYLRPGDRPLPDQLNMRKPPPSNYGPIDPSLILLYSSAQDSKPGGTVQDLCCYRDGDLRWRKKVYIPHNEVDKAYAEYLNKRKGVFVYTLEGDVKSVQRKPANVPAWNNL